MRRARALVPIALAAATLLACGGPSRSVRAPTASRPRPTGAVLLAHPGSAAPFGVGNVDVVRGRVRFHVDPDGGATRARDVLSDLVTHGVALPASLGGGMALLSEHGLTLAAKTGGLRPIVRAELTALSLGARELWARERGALDWVRIDLGKATAVRELPPIAAPILTPWASLGTSGGRSVTTGPEFAGASFAVAIVDLLGPVLTRDGGETWAPFDPNAVAAAFPTSPPNRVLRDGATLLLASDDRAVTVSSSGSLGAPMPPPKPAAFPEIASLRIEQVTPFGVPLEGDEVLIADGGRFAIVQLDPVRVVRSARAPDVSRCELSPSPRKGELAAAACIRHPAGPTSVGGQLAIGAVVEGASGPSLVVDRTFAYGTGHRFTTTSALVIAATCAGSSEGGIDLLGATKVCVRDASGAYSDLAITSIAGRRHVLPRVDGGVLIVRDDSLGRTELVALPRSATAATKPLRLKLDVPLRELLAIDEIARGRFIVWRRTETALHATTIEVSDVTLRVAHEGRRTILDGNAMVGTYGERALVAVVAPPQGKEPARISASLTTDGTTFTVASWPDELPPLDGSAAGRRVECGPVGCRLLGWSRLGWLPGVLSHDRVVSIDDAPTLGAPQAPPSRSSTIAARCTSSGPPQTVPRALVPISPPGYPPQPNEVLLGLPPPKVPKDHVQVLTPFAGTRNVRGGLITVGPIHGAWGDNARTFVRFASDLDPLGVVHETPSFASPFPDRMSAQVGYYGARSTTAAALAPGRILLVMCTYGRCDVQRLTAGAPPERIDLGNVVMSKFVNARELGGTLAILGTGTRRELATPTKLVEPTPFVALIDATGTSLSFLARSGWSDDPRAALTVDATRGAFGVLSLSPLPTWTEGSAYVLPIGAAARPSGAFEALAAPSPELSRPTKACGPSAAGWDEADVKQSRTLVVRIDGDAPMTHSIVAGALRSRVSATGACLDRFTALSRTASFQYEASSHRALLFALDPDGKTGSKAELTCSIDWE